MTSKRADNAPKISLSPHQGSEESGGFQLNRQCYSTDNFIEITTFETERAVTLVCRGLNYGSKIVHLDIMEALQSGFLELVETGTNRVIDFGSDGPHEPGRINIKPIPLPKARQARTHLETRSTDKAWKTVLQPGKSYEMRLSEYGGDIWAYYTENEHPESAAQKLTVGRDTSGTIKFDVYDYPPPPKLFAKLIMLNECYASNTLLFRLTIEFSTDSRQPITFDTSYSPLSSSHIGFHSLEELIECRDIETGEDVDWPTTRGCFDSDPHSKFPNDDDFIEVRPDRVWRYEYIDLNNSENSNIGGVDSLETGRTYESQVATCHHTCYRWMFGRKDGLLKGSHKEKE
ncbi:hypothetical protein GQ44DRAFT_729551 [Phaeosphaeriaceae sp. PMI808]|nr:hypothetical protein GQ44DRAFT_729551 [Phaeosphaeriaceae sp. PMI808]